MPTSCARNHLLKSWLLLSIIAAGISAGYCAEQSDPLLELFIQKGMLTREEVNRVRAEAESIRTNTAAMPSTESKWKIANAVKSIEVYGDVRVRYEQREAETPADTRLQLDRARVAVHVGLRGELLDDFYYGVRLETSNNPRSAWVTFGSSSSTPFGKSSYNVNFGQAYLGWRAGSWGEITLGKMPNPLYTTSMVWDPDLNPEGAAEHLKYSIGQADFFANFGQFLYQDNNPNYISGSLLPSVAPTPTGTRPQESTDNTFLIAWQGGVNYHLTRDISAKVAGGVYQYVGLQKTVNKPVGYSPNGIGDDFIGEGSFGGTNSSAPINGLTSQNGVSYNQVGLDHLLILEVPFEFNFNFSQITARIFGDYAYNLEGSDRATAAVRALAAANVGVNNSPPLLRYGAQSNDRHAYQAGLAIGSRDSIGLVTGAAYHRHGWELRGYWQHVEQYALDPNLLDSDFFEGRGNIQGVYAALSYGLAANVTGTVRYGYGWRINDKLGTGGNNQDIPQINPINHYSLLQIDLGVSF
jgi:hypothetical protein